MEEKQNENEIKKVEQLLSSQHSKYEEDKIEGLDLDCYDDYINSIFPHNFDNSFQKEIIENIKDYKNIPFINSESITIFSIAKAVNADSFYSFFFGIKKIDENKADIYYRLIKKQNIISSIIIITSKYEYKENSDNLKNIDLNIDNKKSCNQELIIKVKKKITELIQNLIKEFCGYIKNEN